MDIEEFREELEENSVREHYGPTDECRRLSDNKWILCDIADELEIVNVKSYTKDQLINRIMSEEMRLRLFTKDSDFINRQRKEDFEINCKKDDTFQPYTIEIYIGSKQKETQFKEALKEAKEELCSSADWILSPLFKALGMRH